MNVCVLALSEMLLCVRWIEILLSEGVRPAEIGERARGAVAGECAGGGSLRISTKHA
jgi:hypothetical protein